VLSAHAAPAVIAAVSWVAQYLLAVPVVLVLSSVLARRRVRIDLIEAAVAGALTIAFVKLGGEFYAHARPFVVYRRPPLVPHAPDNAFPSDHLAACGLAVGYLWNRNRVFAIAAGVCAAFIGAARVLAGLHWPLDIAAGFAFGLAAAALARAVPALYARCRRKVDVLNKVR
jgi:undecaprenyl-diphosphatase